MNQSEKKTFLVKVQEIENKIQDLKLWVESLRFDEANLFDHVDDSPILFPAESAIPADAAPRKARVRIKDGTMTAEMIAIRLKKELGKEISRQSVIQVGKHINAKPVYSANQHVSRYSPESVNMIMNLYRSFNQL